MYSNDPSKSDDQSTSGYEDSETKTKPKDLKEETLEYIFEDETQTHRRGVSFVAQEILTFIETDNTAELW